jgi:hypothetical protein
MTIRVRVRGAGRFDRLARRLDAAAAQLPGRLTDAVRGEGQPVLGQVRAAWLGVDVTSSKGGGSSSGLRARTAAATQLEPIPDGVRVEVDGEAIDPAYGRSLSWYLTGFGRWRHPVHGNTNAWAQQAGQRVFHETLYGYRPQWEQGLERVVDRTAREIEG